jgi:hypothetical protein
MAKKSNNRQLAKEVMAISSIEWRNIGGSVAKWRREKKPKKSRQWQQPEK